MACGEKVGTNAGYARHRRAKEKACDQCLSGKREHQKTWVQSNPTAASEISRNSRRKWRDANRDTERDKARQRARVRYWANPEAGRAAAREYRERNPDAVRERNQRWREANPDYGKRKRAADPEAARKARRDRYAANIDHNRVAARRYAQTRRALKLEASIAPFSTEQLAARMAYYGNRCWICRTGPFEHVDHVKPLAKGGAHILANLRPACAPCNLIKSDQWPYPLTERNT